MIQPGVMHYVLWALYLNLVAKNVVQRNFPQQIEEVKAV